MIVTKYNYYISKVEYDKSIICLNVYIHMSHFFSPRKLLKGLILLQMEKEGAIHGYGLANLIEEKYDWKPNQSTIYNILKSLESNGWVSSDKKIKNSRIQKIYSLTQKGQKNLQHVKDKFQEQMLKRLAHTFLFMRNINEDDNFDENEHADLMEIINLIGEVFYASLIISKSQKEAVFEILNKTKKDLEQIASTYDIDLDYCAHHVQKFFWKKSV